MIVRCLIYLVAVVLSLVTFAVGLVEVLFRSQVKPILEVSRTSQEKTYAPYLEDLQFLERAPLLASSKTIAADAGKQLNPKIFWAPRLGSSARGAAAPVVPLPVKEDLIRLRGDWMRKFARIRNINPDLSLFKDLETFDGWDIEKDSPLADLASARAFVPPPGLPVPETADLLALVKLRLMQGAYSKDFVAALREVRALARLMMSTENLQLVVAGLATLDHERYAYRFFVDELRMPAAEWTPIDRNLTRRAHRAVLATRSFLQLWTRGEQLEKIFLADSLPIGFCPAVNEAFPMIFSLRGLLEPSWPFEMKLKSEYHRMNAIWRRAETACRVRYLTALQAEDSFDVAIPGPLILNRLPYSRKIFGLRFSVMSFTGFDDYKSAPR